MINSEQIRAARALLDWSTKELARLTDMTVNGINKIERGHVNAHQDSLNRIQQAFENAGIEFIPGSGIRKKDRIVETYEGEGSNNVLLDDVYKTLRDIGGEVLISGVNEKLAIEDLDAAFLSAHLERLHKANITERILIRKGDMHFSAPVECYRWVEPQFFSLHSMFIYGPKLALVSWTPNRRCIIIHDEGFAESTRRLFNCVWQASQPPVLQEIKK